MKKISIAGQVISICPHFQSSFQTTRDPNRAHWISTFWFSEMSGIDKTSLKPIQVSSFQNWSLQIISTAKIW